MGKLDDDAGVQIEADLAQSVALQRRGTWRDYPLGVAATLEHAGLGLRGANLLIHGEVPQGAGLSSSAAIEVATALALLEIAGHSLDRVQLARLCQQAENEFVGARCGIMDQFVACHGRAGHALKLDCRSLQYELLLIPDYFSGRQVHFFGIRHSKLTALFGSPLPLYFASFG